MLRKVAFGAGLFGTIVVVLGWIPGLSPHAGHERMMFNAFAISAIDDITHGLTALAAFAAAFHSDRASRLFLVTFGSYYALDATFYLLNGFVNDLPWMSDIILNLPHVVVSTVMLAAAYGIRPSPAEERAGGAARRVSRLRFARTCRRAAACTAAALALVGARCTPAETGAGQADRAQAPAVHPPRGPAVPFTHMRRSDIRIGDAGVMVIRTDAAWRALWRRYGDPGRVPAVDFSREMVAAVSMGSFDSCAEWPHFVQRVEQTADSLFVSVFFFEVDPPGPYCDYRPEAVDLVRMPRSELPVRFVPHQSGFVVPGPARWLVADPAAPAAERTGYTAEP